MAARHVLRALVGLAGAFLCGAAIAAANILILNGNAPGEGFNDPTPASPVGGNPGTTLGQQRLNVLQYAASLWASRLNSNSTPHWDVSAFPNQLMEPAIEVDTLQALEPPFDLTLPALLDIGW